MSNAHLRAESITKSFGMVRALDNVSVSVRKGEVIGLLGDNGAGKTTLLRILCGIYRPDSGRLLFQGKKIQLSSVRDALRNGVGIIHQDLALLENLSIAENLFLLREPATQLGVVKIANRKRMRAEAKEILENFGFSHLDPMTRVANLSGGERQSIAILRCVHFKANVILMDEPTTNLSLNESEHVLEQIRKLSNEGVSIILVSHNLGLVFSVADRFVVVERGKKIADVEKENTTAEKIAALIKGLPVTA